MQKQLRIALVCACLSGAAVAHAAPDIADKFAIGAGGGTDHKPQSKLWFHDGTWWTIVFDGSNHRIWKFENGAFTKQTYPDAVADARASARADILWDGTHLHVLMWHGVLPRYVKYSYDSVTQQYHKLAGFPLDLPIGETECMVLDRDSTGRLWASFEKDLQIHVLWTTTPDHLTWDLTGTVIATNISDDDITSTVAFGGDRIGVLWSDQSIDAPWEFGFRVHRDIDPPEVWQPLEVIDTESAVDDHMNIKADASGRLYMVGKDLFNHIQLYVREPAGGWSRAASNINAGICTRPIVQLDTANDLVRVFYTDWITSPNAIRTASAPLSTLVFGTPETYLTPTSLSLNDVTGTKQILSAVTGVMAMASSSSSAYWGFTHLGPPPPPLAAPRAVAGLRATRSGNDIVLGWNPVSEDTTGALITVARYHVYSGANPRFTPDRSGRTNRIGVVAGTSFTALGALQSPTEAYYLVTAERSGGTESNHASNLAYRRRVHLDAPPGGGSRTAYIALPHHTSATSAAALVQSMNGGAGATPVLAVSRLTRATQIQHTWSHETGVWTGSDFALLPGEPVAVTTVAAFDWDCIGAETETPVYDFDFHLDIGNVNWVSLPQNVTYTDAHAVVEALNAGTTPGSVTKIGWLDPSTGAMENWVFYAGDWRGTNFLLQPGQALAILVGHDLPSWTPARFLP